MSEDLFGDSVGGGPPQAGGSLADSDRSGLPLAVRMRPRTLDEFVGQQHLLAPGVPLRRLVDRRAPMSVFLWGPPGIGKTTIAHRSSRARPTGASSSCRRSPPGSRTSGR